MTTFLQSPWWGTVKEGSGWRVTVLPDGEGRLEDVQVLQRRAGPWELAYIPWGWDTAEPREKALEHILDVVAAMPRRLPRVPDLIRWDVPWDARTFHSLRESWGGERRFAFLPSPMRVQPPDTVLVDLHPEDADLLAAMKSKTRYNIRLAERRGVEVEILPWHTTAEPRRHEAFAQWYRLYEETARRDRITIHPPGYYRRVLDLAVSTGISDTADAPESAASSHAPVLTLFRATHEKQELGGIITVSWGGTTTYLYGASADHKRNLMASYLLQWTAMRHARAAGDGTYDLFGIPPAEDPEHPMHGLYRFKTGFGGSIVHRAGAWDYPVRPCRAGLYRRVEGCRRWYYHSFRKATGGRRGVSGGSGA